MDDFAWMGKYLHFTASVKIRLTRSKTRPQVECPCGINKQACTYHQEIVKVERC